MAQIIDKISSQALLGAGLPLMLKLGERVNPAPLNASATNQEQESNPQYENSPQGPTMRPWRTQTDNGGETNTDYAED
ncbi:hypothetical protein [Actinoplanes sp. ATCC 53533]|uniref:hypothetical protein n=1 Tax=Actinoplanes sp. ATCC 53533 TaxID=1288362 RepID=UPI000F789363|nr:hypothetical protein [Actinoplanes sp. ATCC 53533]